MTCAARSWLNDLNEPGAYKRMLEDAGSLCSAAWRLAQAKCMVYRQPTAVPTAIEVYASAREIAERARLHDSIPTAQALKSMCEASGLPVL